jgi:heme-degrading monooxygenase HmoA
MIARIWNGTATTEDAERYATHFRESVLPGLQELDGFRGAYLMRRAGEGTVEFRAVTLWASLDAIRAFAGEDITIAVVEPAAQAVLTGYDTTVALYDIAAHA